MSTKLLKLLAITALTALPSLTYASTFTINSANDTVDALPGDGICADSAGQCTIRAAVMEANNLKGWDTIKIPGGTYELTISGNGEDLSETGDLDLTDDVNIEGQIPFITSPAVTIKDNSKFLKPKTKDRIFHIHNNVSAKISAMTLSDGRTSDVGGAIYSEGELSLNQVYISNNTSKSGGGIYHEGNKLTVKNSSINQNSATAGGGGMAVKNSKSLIIQKSTISENSIVSENRIIGAGIAIIDTTTLIEKSEINNNTLDSESYKSGGGIYFNSSDSNKSLFISETTIDSNQLLGERSFNSGAGIYITNDSFDDTAKAYIGKSTISNNYIEYDSSITNYPFGGGIHIDQSTEVNINNSTISSNTYSGIHSEYNVSLNISSSTIHLNKYSLTNVHDVTTYLKGSIISGGKCDNTLSSSSVKFYSKGYNLISNSGTCSISPKSGDLIGSSSSTINPELQALADNGGLTHTHLPLAISKAINGGEKACTDLDGSSVSEDQRGESRGVICDIGAVESNSNKLKI